MDGSNRRSAPASDDDGDASREVPPLYQRIGGHAALETVVDDLYLRILADERLSPFFAGTDLTRMKGRQVEFFAALLGGPTPYVGASMRTVHRGRGITAGHFGLVAGHLTDALTAAGLDRELTDQVIGAVASLAGDIATARESPTPP
ncbi:group I truncated hemoglobin [Nocardia alba]|uniref:Hemoglobin n=1 Tax=Nocardia alba TaxID=225051 RepID=A0A4R1FRL3_9NOCA|nr:group 1 truncated hemoglobin [Nocardia alba]TCJ97403.1 hemoglobin [Nocardia alba]